MLLLWHAGTWSHVSDVLSIKTILSLISMLSNRLEKRESIEERIHAYNFSSYQQLSLRATLFLASSEISMVRVYCSNGERSWSLKLFTFLFFFLACRSYESLLTVVAYPNIWLFFHFYSFVHGQSNHCLFSNALPTPFSGRLSSFSASPVSLFPKFQLHLSHE